MYSSPEYLTRWARHLCAPTFVLLAGCMVLERYLTIKQNGPLLVFGQTALFFYIIHRVVFDATACLLDLHASMSLTAVSLVSVIQVRSSRQLAAPYP